MEINDGDGKQEKDQTKKTKLGKILVMVSGLKKLDINSNK